jgi:hypothetical protein
MPSAKPLPRTQRFEADKIEAGPLSLPLTALADPLPAYCV